MVAHFGIGKNWHWRQTPLCQCDRKEVNWTENHCQKKILKKWWHEGKLRIIRNTSECKKKKKNQIKIIFNACILFFSWTFFLCQYLFQRQYNFFQYKCFNANVSLFSLKVLFSLPIIFFSDAKIYCPCSSSITLPLPVLLISSWSHNYFYQHSWLWDTWTIPLGLSNLTFLRDSHMCQTSKCIALNCEMLQRMQQAMVQWS